MQDTALVLLAAGRSARLGTPKQLLMHEGRSFVRRAASTAIEADMGRVYVVLGAAANEVSKELEGLPVTTMVNEGWEEGMGSSIRRALEMILTGSIHPERILVMVCDQPKVNSDLLRELADRMVGSGKPVVACRYGDVSGTPAVFDRTMYPMLLELCGDRGAGKLIASMPDRVETVDFPAGSEDIDTMEDYQRFQTSTQGI